MFNNHPCATAAAAVSVFSTVKISVKWFCKQTKKEEEEKKAFITREIFEEMKLKTKNKYISYHNLIA